jgi:hypothetical protein
MTHMDYPWEEDVPSRIWGQRSSALNIEEEIRFPSSRKVPFLPKVTILHIWTTHRRTGCRSQVEVLLLSIQEVVSSSPARAGHVKPKTLKIGSDCFFAKSTAFRSENHGSFGYDLNNGGPVSQ